MNTLDILSLLMTTRSSSKIIAAAFGDNYSPLKISKKLSYLKNKNFIHSVNDLWEITDPGRKYYIKKNKFKYFNSSFTKDSIKNRLIIFDIPETERAKRDWLRYQIKQFHYDQIQRSVWYGPSPLPKEFMSYLEELGIRDYIKIFKSNKEI